VARICLAAAGLLLPGPDAAAEEGKTASRPRVVIVSMVKCCPDSAWPEAEAKVAFELSALGARVERTDGASAAGHAHGNQLARVLDDQDVAAALRIVRTDKGSATADLLYRDAKTKKAVSKRVTFSPAPGAEAVPVAALKIVELLTAGVAELSLRPADTPSPPPPAEPAPAPPEASAPVGPAGTGRLPETDRKDVSLRAGAGAVLAPGNVTFLPAGFLAAEVAVAPRWSVEGEASLSLPGRTVPYGDARADFFEGTLRGWALWEAARFGSFTGTVGAGAGVVFVDVAGHSATTQKGVEDLVVTGYAGATSRLGLPLTDAVEIGICLNVGATIPRVKVRYSLEDSPFFGWPFVETAIGMKLAVF
jgi:hypothetical protein